MTETRQVYLDYAAATPLDERVLAVMVPYFADKFYNPSSPYAPAVEVRRELEEAKHRLAQCIGAKPVDIIMTAGATESINLAMTAAGDGHIVTTAIEHPAVLESAKTKQHEIVYVGDTGIVDSDAIATAITAETQLVSVALANNELGTIQPIRRVSEIVTKERQRRQEFGEDRPIWLHCDASQGVGQIDINIARMGVDLLTLNAGKCYGPKQVGLLWHASQVRLNPIIHGGGQEMNLRSGTENVAGIIGFAKALELSTKSRHSEAQRLAKLRDDLQNRLVSAIPTLIMIGHTKKRLPGHLHVSIPGIDAERLIYLLEARGVYVATGSACAANHGTRSHVLEAIGLAPEVADGSLRITLGRFTDEGDIEYAAEAIIEAVNTELKRVKQ